MSTPGTPTPNLSAFIWGIANLLRGTYKQADYGKVVLPFTVDPKATICRWVPIASGCSRYGSGAERPP